MAFAEGSVARVRLWRVESDGDACFDKLRSPCRGEWFIRFRRDEVSAGDSRRAVKRRRHPVHCQPGLSAICHPPALSPSPAPPLQATVASRAASVRIRTRSRVSPGSGRQGTEGKKSSRWSASRALHHRALANLVPLLPLLRNLPVFSHHHHQSTPHPSSASCHRPAHRLTGYYGPASPGFSLLRSTLLLSVPGQAFTRRQGMHATLITSSANSPSATRR